MDILAGFGNTRRATADPPAPQDNNAGDHGEQVPEEGELDTRPEDDELDTRHPSMEQVVNRFCSEDNHVLCADGQVIYIRYTILIPCIKQYFELFMSCPKDELHQWYVVYTWYILGKTLTYLLRMTYVSEMVCDRNRCSLQTLGCLEWESELYTGRYIAKVYLKDITGIP